MRFDMFTQMVTSHKFLTTFRTLEPFFSRVRPSVSLQLIGARESLAAEEPGANKRSFTRVPAQMST